MEKGGSIISVHPKGSYELKNDKWSGPVSLSVLQLESEWVGEDSSESSSALPLFSLYHWSSQTLWLLHTQSKY